jgi:hypothetical protein
MKNASDKSCRENKKHNSRSVTLFSFENRAVYEAMWKNIVQRGQAADNNMAHAHCMLGN